MREGSRINWLAALMGGIGVLVTLGALLGYVWASRIEGAAAQWPTVTGRVIESRVENEGSDYGITPKVTYSYVVGGRSYTGNVIWATGGISYGSQADVDAFLAPYRTGAPVTVHYDPANPANAALIVGSWPWPFLAASAMGLVFAAAGWFGRRRRQT